jgi:hypothetical protein
MEIGSFLLEDASFGFFGIYGFLGFESVYNSNADI